MVSRIRVIPGEPETAEDYLHNADDDILACRGQGHAFPKLRRTKRGGIKGITVRPQAQGVYRIEAACPDCGTVRIMDTLPGGEVANPQRYSYIYPQGYKAPKGAGVTRRGAFEETWRRTREELATSAQIA